MYSRSTRQRAISPNGKLVVEIEVESDSRRPPATPFQLRQHVSDAHDVETHESFRRHLCVSYLVGELTNDYVALYTVDSVRIRVGTVQWSGWFASILLEFQTTSSSSFEFEFELARSPPKIFFHVSVE